ncbi:hypothetical protein IYZ83_000415 [Wolbachia pipientis]|nr:hypothetical protein [Wolbachia pipientis]UIP91736.1 hypothetical protein IYZ83_000415 [Wolbachia pipientis]
MLESRNLLSTKVMLGFVRKKPVSATRMTPKVNAIIVDYGLKMMIQ